MEFKENLKQLRLQNGLTQAQLAEKLFVSRSTVAKWENGLGLPNPESMAALEKLFDIVSVDIHLVERVGGFVLSYGLAAKEVDIILVDDDIGLVDIVRYHLV